MITIAERVQVAIAHYEAQRFEFAVEQAVLALDQCSKLFADERHSSRSAYMDFIREYYWVVELMCLPGADLNEVRFTNFTVRSQERFIDGPDLAEIIYHAIRCNIVHDMGIPSFISFDGNRFQTDRGRLVLPSTFVWALIAMIVFSRVAKYQQSASNEYLSCFYDGVVDERWLIQDVWGREDILREVYDFNISEISRINFNLGVHLRELTAQ